MDEIIGLAKIVKNILQKQQHFISPPRCPPRLRLYDEQNSFYIKRYNKIR